MPALLEVTIRCAALMVDLAVAVPAGSLVPVANPAGKWAIVTGRFRADLGGRQPYVACPTRVCNAGASWRHASGMGVVVRPSRLRMELIRRGWSECDLAREARISPATVSAAISGRSISAKSLSLMVEALLKVPTVELIDRLVIDDGGQADLT